MSLLEPAKDMAAEPPPRPPPYRGADLRPEQRPGVPRDAPPHPLSGTHWTEPSQQPDGRADLTPGQRDRATPVFSTAVPPMGVSGAVRRLAHLVPDHHVTHWALLLLADRIDVVQHVFTAMRRGKMARRAP